MRTSRSLYDLFLQSYISLNYPQFFIVIDTVMLFTVALIAADHMKNQTDFNDLRRTNYIIGRPICV